MSRTRNSKFGSSYFFISRGSRGDASSLTDSCCSLPSRTHGELHRAANLVLPDHGGEQVLVRWLRRLDRVVVDLGDDVADPKARGGGGAARARASPARRSCRQAQLARRAAASGPGPTPEPRLCGSRAPDPRGRPGRPRRTVSMRCRPRSNPTSVAIGSDLPLRQLLDPRRQRGDVLHPLAVDSRRSRRRSRAPADLPPPDRPGRTPRTWTPSRLSRFSSFADHAVRLDAVMPDQRQLADRRFDALPLLGHDVQRLPLTLPRDDDVDGLAERSRITAWLNSGISSAKRTVTFSPATESTMSPGWKPALAAGEPSIVPPTSAPVSTVRRLQQRLDVEPDPASLDPAVLDDRERDFPGELGGDGTGQSHADLVDPDDLPLAD